MGLCQFVGPKAGQHFRQYDATSGSRAPRDRWAFFLFLYLSDFFHPCQLEDKSLLLSASNIDRRHAGDYIYHGAQDAFDRNWISSEEELEHQG